MNIYWAPTNYVQAMPVGWDTEMNEYMLSLKGEILDSVVMQRRRFQKMWGMQNET